MLNKKYYVYLILTENGSFYCGYTNDVLKRYKIHVAGKGAKYTQSHKPVKLAWYKEFATKSQAMKEEIRIKKLSHNEKKQLAES
jgi:putative endonuclease